MAAGLKLSSKSFGTAEELTDLYVYLHKMYTHSHTANNATGYDAIELTVKK